MDDPYVSAILEQYEIAGNIYDTVETFKLQEDVVNRLGGYRVDKSEVINVGLACPS